MYIPREIFRKITEEESMDQVKICNFIAELRKEKNDQKELAEAIGISDKAISKWEWGVPAVKDTALQPRLLLLDRYSRRAG